MTRSNSSPNRIPSEQAVYDSAPFDANSGELLVARNPDEAIDTYRWLVDSQEEALEFGNRARERVVREHIFHHRARHSAKRFGILGAEDGDRPWSG